MSKTKLFITLLSIGVLSLGIWSFLRNENDTNDVIPIGILHSQTGTMAISEKDVIDATLLAIEEINQSGGLLGHQLKPIIKDGRSDWPTFARHAEELIIKEKVPVIFGCWTSASRKMVKPIVEKHNHLLFYPVQYEGLESSKNIVYMGAAPNQQIIPGVTWALETLGKKIFLIGSDYVFPHAAHKILTAHINALGGTVVGQEYIRLGSKDQTSIGQIIEKIKQAQPNVIFNSINGDTNIAFFKQLRQAGITPEKIPTISCSIAEPELAHLGTETMVGDYAVWNYFQSIDTPFNHTFVKKFHARFGSHRKISDPMEAAYIGVHIWAQTVRSIRSFDPRLVTKNLPKQSIAAPSGAIYIHATNNHAYKQVRIGKIQLDGQFALVWDSSKSIAPNPYPPYKSVASWSAFLQNLYHRWGNKWENSIS